MASTADQADLVTSSGPQRRLIVIAPTPPPIHGVAFMTPYFVEAVRRSGQLAAHLDTRDPRPVVTSDRFDLTNAYLGFRHSIELARLLARYPNADVYLPVSQGHWGFLRDAAFIGLSRLSGRRVIIHLHGGRFPDFYRDSGWLLRLVIRRTLLWVDEAWVLTPAHEAIFDGLIPRARVRTLENASDDMRELSHASEAPRAESSLRVLYMSNLIPEKGCFDLLEAVDRLGTRAAGMSVRLVGEAEDHVRREVSRRARKLARRGVRIEAVGVRLGSNKAMEYKWADVFVFPSRFIEGQPLVLLEAMSAGLPIVSTDHPGIAHTVRHGQQGLLVPPGDIAALASAIASLGQDVDLRERLAAQARERYETRYRPEAFYDAVEALLARK